MANAGDFPGPAQTGQIGIYRTPPLALPQTTSKTLFSWNAMTSLYGGPIEIIDLFGIITTVIGAVANATKLQAIMDALTAVDLCATLDINAKPAGGILNITGTVANAMTENDNGVAIAQVTPIHCSGGVTTGGIIRVNCAGSDGGTGRVQWFLVARAAYGVVIKPAQS